MSWKSWPYWLKGIILFEGIWFSLWVIYLLIGQTDLWGPYGSINKVTYYQDVIPTFLFISIFVILLGLIIGLIYGKIKNRSQ